MTLNPEPYLVGDTACFKPTGDIVIILNTNRESGMLDIQYENGTIGITHYSNLEECL